MDKRRKPLAIYILNLCAVLCLLVIAAATVQLLWENHQAALLTIQGIPDLRDLGHTEYWLLLMICSGIGLLCLMTAGWLEKHGKRSSK